MADVIKMTDGTTSVDLYYDTDGFEMLAGGNDFGTAKHKNLYHESAALDGAMLVRHSKENRAWSFKLAVRGANNTAIATTLGTFNRLVDQARRYQLSSSGQKVYLEIQLDGASQATYYDVIDVDYSKAAFFNYYNLRQKELIFGDGLSLTVLTKPLGYGAEETLQNFLANPHFMAYIGAGAADCWNASGTPTLYAENEISLIGGQSQEVQVGATGTHGIYSDPIDCTAYQGEDFVAYAWIYNPATPGDDVTLDVVGDVSGSLGTAGRNAATETVTAIDSTFEFCKVRVSGTIGASDTEITIRIERLTGDASEGTTFWVDKCFFGMGISTEPSAYSSCQRINNYMDEDAWPYIDIADSVGDCKSPLQIDIYPASSSAATYIYAATIEMQYRYGYAYKVPYYVSIYWQELIGTADVGRTQDEIKRIAATTSWQSIDYLSAVLDNFSGEYVVMAAIKSSVAGTAKIRCLLNDTYTDEKEIALTTSYKLFVSPPVSYRNIEHLDAISGYCYLQLALASGTANVDTDFLMMVPISYGYIISNPGTVTGFARITTEGTALKMTTYPSAVAAIGGAINIDPSVDQRIVFMFHGDTSHTLSSADTIIRYRPQTEFLLP